MGGVGAGLVETMASGDMALIPMTFPGAATPSREAHRRPMPISYGIYRREALVRSAPAWQNAPETGDRRHGNAPGQVLLNPLRGAQLHPRRGAVQRGPAGADA